MLWRFQKTAAQNGYHQRELYSYTVLYSLHSRDVCDYAMIGLTCTLPTTSKALLNNYGLYDLGYLEIAGCHTVSNSNPPFTHQPWFLANQTLLVPTENISLVVQSHFGPDKSKVENQENILRVILRICSSLTSRRWMPPAWNLHASPRPMYIQPVRAGSQKHWSEPE